VISIVVAHGANGVIGDAGQLPWRLPSDMRRFRELTTGGTVVNPKDTGANIDGDALEGATDHHMKTGDFIFVPAGLPHLAVTDGTFVLATLHVPKP